MTDDDDHEDAAAEPVPPQTLYRPFEDPAAFDGTEEQRLAKFREVRDQIEMRIELWLKEEG